MLRPPPISTLFPYTTLFRSTLRLWRASSYSPLTLDLPRGDGCRSEEHTSELQSRVDLVCRLLLEKKKFISASSITDRSQFLATPMSTHRVIAFQRSIGPACI